MGVDTKIRIPMKGTVPEMVQEVKKALKALKTFGKITTRLTHAPKEYDKENDKSRFDMHEIWDICFALNFPCDQFESGKEERRVWAYFDHYDNNGDNMLYLSLGAWGHNEEIAKCLVDTFGGYANFNDCDDISIDYAMPQPKVKEIA